MSTKETTKDPKSFQGSASEKTKSSTSKMFSESNKKDKYCHSSGDACSYFPIFYIGYILRIVGGYISFGLGICLLISGSWANSALFALWGITQGSWPKIQVEDPNFHAFALEFATYVGWICGFFLLFLAFYMLWTAFVLHGLFFAKWPWTREEWTNVRTVANDQLVVGGVRDESLADQFGRMNEKQQDDMSRFFQSSIPNQSGEDRSSK